MEKQVYWTSVSSYEIAPQGELGNHQFEIEATADELAMLQALYSQLDAVDKKMASITVNPSDIFQHPNRTGNQNFDETLRKVYRLIYDLGRPATKEHIARMNMI